MENFDRPSRSDARLSKEEASKIEGETRDYFNGIAPQRHAKPQRSEYSASYNDAQFHGQENDVIPEYIEFQNLQKDDPQVCLWFISCFAIYFQIKNFSCVAETGVQGE